MKKIFITGADSFVGTSVQKHFEKSLDKYNVQIVGTKYGEWKNINFSCFDVVYHVAGLRKLCYWRGSGCGKRYLLNGDLCWCANKKYI